jgi:tRNA nucleotidyltransferase (CCA-adding enzyme)
VARNDKTVETHHFYYINTKRLEHKMNNINSPILYLPDYVNNIIETIENSGYEAFVVGGCVRDLIIGTPPHDYDIATSAKPEEMEKIFPKVKATGLRYGTVSVIEPQGIVEVTTYRIDNDYEDCRHPNSVIFSNQIIDDLSRRDFTINAMAYNQQQGLIDPFGGLQDIKNRLIRAVGNPYTRFNEDALRILRAYRFAAKLDFEIDENTKKSSIDLAQLVSKVSVERIKIELEKTLISPKPSIINQLLSTGAINFLGFVNENTKLYMLDLVDSTAFIRWSVFFHLHNMNSEQAKKILQNLKFDNKTAHQITLFLKQLQNPLPQNKVQIKQILSKIDRDIYVQLLDTYYILTKNPNISKCKKYLAEITQNNECYNLNMLAVNGNDLIRLYEGKNIGIMLKKMLEEVIEHPENNQKCYLLSEMFLNKIKP